MGGGHSGEGGGVQTGGGGEQTTCHSQMEGVGKRGEDMALADEEGALKVPISLKRKIKCKWVEAGEEGLCEQTQSSVRPQRQGCGF